VPVDFAAANVKLRGVLPGLFGEKEGENEEERGRRNALRNRFARGLVGASEGAEALIFELLLDLYPQFSGV
jgi:hypothetical protein